MKVQLRQCGIVRKQAFLLELGRLSAWVYVAVMLTSILISLPLTPVLWRFMVRTFGQGFNSVAYVVSTLLIVGFVVYMIRHRERFGFLGFFFLAGLASLYFYLLKYQCHFPAERFHLIEYGLLAYLLYRALRFDFSRAKAYGLAFLLSSTFGLLDEVIQYFLPNRVFELRDVLTNVIASLLGLAAVAVLIRERAIGVLSRGVSK